MLMATIQQQIIEKFLERLTESKKIDTERIEQLRTLLSGTTQGKDRGFRETLLSSSRR